MARFKWTKAYAVFLPQVDAEHRNLFRMADELHHAASGGSGAGPVRELTRALVAAIEEHFWHEERIMKGAAVPDLDWHLMQHGALLKRLRVFAAEIEQGKAESVTAMLDYLGRWLKDHLALTDRMMASHVRNYERLHAKVAS